MLISVGVADFTLPRKWEKWGKTTFPSQSSLCRQVAGLAEGAKGNQNMRLRISRLGVWIVVSSLTSCEILSKLFRSSEPKFPHFYKWGYKDSLQSRVPQQWQYWHLGPENSLMWVGAWPVQCRMFRSIQGCYLLKAGSTYPSCDNQKYLQMLSIVPWRVKLPLFENHCCKENHP